MNLLDALGSHNDNHSTCVKRFENLAYMIQSHIKNVVHSIALKLLRTKYTINILNYFLCNLTVNVLRFWLRTMSALTKYHSLPKLLLNTLYCKMFYKEHSTRYHCRLANFIVWL